MHPKLKLAIHEGIENAINNFADQHLWEELMPPSTVFKMTEAAVAVFDVAQDAAEFQKESDS